MHSAPLGASLPYSVSADSACASGAKRQRRRTPCSLLPRTSGRSTARASAHARLAQVQSAEAGRGSPLRDRPERAPTGELGDVRLNRRKQGCAAGAPAWPALSFAKSLRRGAESVGGLHAWRSRWMRGCRRRPAMGERARPVKQTPRDRHRVRVERVGSCCGAATGRASGCERGSPARCCPGVSRAAVGVVAVASTAGVRTRARLVGAAGARGAVRGRTGR